MQMKPTTASLLQSFRTRRIKLCARAACYRPALAAKLYTSLCNSVAQAIRWERRLNG